MATHNNHIKRWILPEPIKNDEILDCQVNFILQKVLTRRGINLNEGLINYLIPLELPNPEAHFEQLNKVTQRIIDACERNEKIAICGDYDADGITSTVLLVELLSKLGAKPISFIPSRLDEGYGLNLKMVDDIYSKEIKLIITVDNGISAFDAIRRAKEFDIDLIITDHHKIPNCSLDIFALIHPEKTPDDSPYKYLSVVGIAYMIARNLCHKLDYDINQTAANVLFCIGTIADMASLLGANRYWIKKWISIQEQVKNTLGMIQKLEWHQRIIEEKQKK